MKLTSYLLSALSAALLLPCAAQSEATSTIDPQIQAVVQAAISAPVEKADVDYSITHGGMLVMDPRTGHILAMAERHADGTTPTDGSYLLKTGYAPGNTFTVLTTAAALESGVVTADSLINCNPFTAADGKLISDVPFQYGAMAMKGVVIKGSRPGAARMALSAKGKSFCDMLTRFGFAAEPKEGSLLGSCSVPDGTDAAALAHAGYGTHIAVTPLHMAAAYAALANKGVYTEPRLTTDGTPAEGRRVVSEENAAALLNMLESATRKDNPIPIRRGIASLASVPGVRIAAMTGAQRIAKEEGAEPHGNQLSQYIYRVSCIGLVPADAPQLVVLVHLTVDSTDDREFRFENLGPISGGTVAAPFFRTAVRGLIEAGVVKPTDPDAYAEYLKTL